MDRQFVADFHREGHAVVLAGWPGLGAGRGHGQSGIGDEQVLDGDVVGVKQLAGVLVVESGHRAFSS